MKAAAFRAHMTEEQLADTILGLARLYGWRRMHQRPALTNKGWRTLIQGDKGFPDLVLARNGRVIFAELKSETGRVEPDQERWMAAIGDVYLWRPSDLEEIRELLR